MNFGPQTSEADAFRIMDRAHELGINFFDTANVYGQRKGVGTTEAIVGNWFAKQFSKLVGAEKNLVQKSGYFARSAASNASSASSGLRVSGFSQRTCFPAARARTDHSTWREFGREM